MIEWRMEDTAAGEVTSARQKQNLLPIIESFLRARIEATDHQHSGNITRYNLSTCILGDKVLKGGEVMALQVHDVCVDPATNELLRVCRYGKRTDHAL